MRLLDHVRSCTEISTKLILCHTMPAKNAQIFFTLDMVLSLEIFDYGMLYMLMYSAYT